MRIRFWIVIICGLLLSGCATVPPPSNAHDVCSIFHQYPDWYYATKRTEQQWKVPVSVQMAIIYQESSFNATAKPPRDKLLGFIPWSRPTTAYGYCQAVDPTWNLYQRRTAHYDSQRYDFADATQFIGWYASRAKARAGVSPKDAYSLYLAYHEGITNYMHKSYLQKPWLIKVAKRVKSRAKLYHAQLLMCDM